MTAHRVHGTVPNCLRRKLTPSSTTTPWSSVTQSRLIIMTTHKGCLEHKEIICPLVAFLLFEVLTAIVACVFTVLDFVRVVRPRCDYAKLSRALRDVGISYTFTAISFGVPCAVCRVPRAAYSNRCRAFY